MDGDKQQTEREVFDQEQYVMSLINRDRITMLSEAVRFDDQALGTRDANASSSAARNAFITVAADTPSFDRRVLSQQNTVNTTTSSDTAAVMQQTPAVQDENNDTSLAGATNTANTANQANFGALQNNTTNFSTGTSTTNIPRHPAFSGNGSRSAPAPQPLAPPTAQPPRPPRAPQLRDPE